MAEALVDEPLMRLQTRKTIGTRVDDLLYAAFTLLLHQLYTIILENGN